MSRISRKTLLLIRDGRFESVVHVQLLLGPLQAEFAPSQKGDESLVVRVGFDVRLLF